MEEIFGRKYRFYGLILFLLIPFFQYFIIKKEFINYDMYFTLLLPFVIGIYLFLVKIKSHMLIVICSGVVVYLLMYSFYEDNLTYPKIDNETIMIQNLMRRTSRIIFIGINFIYLINRILKKRD